MTVGELVAILETFNNHIPVRFCSNDAKIYDLNKNIYNINKVTISGDLSDADSIQIVIT